jgi:ferredoxin
MVLYVDGEKCTGCELCTDSLPGVFRINSDGVCEVENVSGASVSEISEVVESCPAECILNK